MDENKFEISGKIYVSSPSDYGCRGCAFEFDFDGCVNEAPDCYRGNSYNPEIIFVEKQP